jgi:putative DNA primase/helicase
MRNEKAASPDRPGNAQGKFTTGFFDPEVDTDGKRLQGAQNVDFAAVLGSLPKGTLSPEHLAILRGSGISDHVIVSRDYRTLEDTKADRTLLSSLGFSETQIRLPGLLIPLYNPLGEIAGCQYRPDDPRVKDGRPIKYETSFKARPVLDVHPSKTLSMQNPDEILWITEGVKKGDALANLGNVAVALSGVWGWIGGNGQGGTTALASWRDVSLKGRQIRIIFDSDAATNPKVQKAETALSQYLEDKGAHVIILRIPPGPDGEKQGIDDYLSNGGRLEDLEPPVKSEPGVGGKTPADELDIAEALDDGSNLVFTMQKFWLFKEQGGIWSELADEAVKRHLQIVCRKNDLPVKDSLIRGAFGAAKARFYRQIEFDRIDRRSIPAANGVLRYREGNWALHPYRREDYRRVKLVVSYDPSAKCPRFERFLEEVFAGAEDLKERVRLILEFLGLSLTSTTEFEKALMLVGSGGNGKSVLIRVLEALIGSWNRSAVQLKQLENRFQRAHLDGKIVNIMTELSEGGEVPDAEIKAIISGEPITAEHKLKPPFEFFPICKMWFLTNHLPSVRDLSDGLFRRFSILTFPNRFDNKPDRDTQLAEKLAAESSGILNYALKALAGVYERGALTEPPSSRMAVDGWRRDADQVAIFIEEECVFEAGACIESKELYQVYTAWARESGIKKMLGRKGFTQRLENLGGERGRGTAGKRLLWGIRRV